MPYRGFILQPTYRIEAGRAVVHLYGRLEDGSAFLVRDTRQAPHFFVRAPDAPRAAARGAAIAPSPLKTMRGEPVVRVEVPLPADAPPLRDALVREGVPVFEGDVRFAMRFLIDRGLRGSIAIHGAPRLGSAPGLLVFEDVEIRPETWRPTAAALGILSIDLETDPRGRHVLSAALFGPAVDEVLLALPEQTAAPARRADAGVVVACGDEKGLLAALFARMRGLDFDILTGWNVVDFDLAVLLAAARRLGVPFEIGRQPGSTRVLRDATFWGRSRADIPGRVVLDGADLLRSSFVALDDYRLDTAARALLGEGKVAVGDPAAEPKGRARAEAIQRLFREDLPRFVAYNRNDARLVPAILEKAGLVDLAIQRSLLTGMPLDRVGASIASFDFLYLEQLRRRGVVAPSVRAAEIAVEPTAGGAVLDPQPGLYDNVLAFDFRSLYPSLILTFNIDPLGHVPDPSPGEKAALIEAPNGAWFRREPGILPGILERLFPQREAARARGDAIAAHAIKILMNSFYGVLATPACRFYSAPVANAITHFGQWLLRLSRDRAEALGYRVLYGDTDSLFVASGLPAAAEDEARRLGADLAARLNEAAAAHIRQAYGVESRLELRFETLYRKFLLPEIRHGGAGARKRYAGLARPAPGLPERVVFVGLEVVRRDWTELAKLFQRGLYERLFSGAPAAEVAAFSRLTVDDLRRGMHDARLVYRKSLRKGIDDYTATTPPHVQAARKMEGRIEGPVEYVMTSAGPEPADARTSPFDYVHYIERQMRPIADQVLPHLGLSFDAILGEASQLALF